MPHRSSRWIWGGRILFGLIVVALAGYLVMVGPDKADKTASGVSAVLALLALGAPYLLPTGTPPVVGNLRVTGTGKATAGSGGSATTGLRAPASRLPNRVVVERTGDADASGGGHANSGVELT